jgi:FPC/CPF motif-containing protein YcgG
MAKAVITRGLLVVHDHHQVEDSLEALYGFIDKYRENPSRLSSFVLNFSEKMSFPEFEKTFWNLLKSFNTIDKNIFSHDSRVAHETTSKHFSFSLKSEALFILALHPESPRWARRFIRPAIVFNPHQQFEALRKRGLFGKIRDIIRKRDEQLQGFINPMLNDFGERSEIYQYTGRMYSPDETLTI